MMTVFDLASYDTRLLRVCSNEYAGPCPGCKGEDRFHVKLTKRDGQGGFMCRYCWPAEEKGWGDKVDYLRHFKHMTYREALQELDIQGPYTNPLPPTHMTHNTAPHKKWQERARGLCHVATQALYGEHGGPGMRYLARRGFTDTTIQEAGYGLIPHDMYDTPSHWFETGGNKNAIKKVFIPAGILIPFYHNGDLWKISIRRKRPPNAKDRYYDLPGSSECLYNADKIATKTTTILYEGVFDALSGQQVAPELAHVATADVQKCRSARWIARLCLAPRVLVAYDADPAGDKASGFWTRTLPHATRWRPWAKDANAMLEQGLDLLEWLVLGLA